MAARQAVVAVDDVDRVGDAADREHRERDRERRPLEEAIETRDVEPRDDRAQQPHAECRGEHGEQEPGQDVDVLGGVFGDPSRERGQAGEEQIAELLARCALLDREQDRSRYEKAGHHLQAADARGRRRMEFLGACVGEVVAPACVERFVAHDQVTRENGCQTGEQQDHQPGGDFARFETLRPHRKRALGVGRIADGRNPRARQALCFPARGKSERLVVRYVGHDSAGQTRARHFDRLFGEQLLVGGLELARALPDRDSTGGTADPDRVGDGRDGGLTGFILAQAVLQELEADVFLGFHQDVGVVQRSVEEMRSTGDRDEQNDRHERGVRFLYGHRGRHVAGCEELRVQP